MSVYFAEAGGYMKIGYSNDPFDRMSTVTRNGERPDDLPYASKPTLIGWIPGGREVEAEYHARFADAQVEGEWFRLDPSDVKDIIWADPAGVVIDRMSAMAVYAAHDFPGLTRDEIAAAGIPVPLTPLNEALERISGWLSRARDGAA